MGNALSDRLARRRPQRGRNPHRADKKSSPAPCPAKTTIVRIQNNAAATK